MSAVTAAALPTAPDTDAELAEQERRLDFTSFDRLDAWRLGTRIVETALERGLAITAAVWLGEQRVFHVGLPGTSADNDQWMDRKAAMVPRYDVASLRTRRRFHGYGVTTELAIVGLDPTRHSLSGGAFPIRVHGALVGVAVVSGIDDDTDHALVVEGLDAHHAAVAPTH
jgi:uncharacterized protein (UPF0303 family)